MTRKRVYLCDNCGYKTTDPEEIQGGDCPKCEGTLFPRLND